MGYDAAGNAVTNEMKPGEFLFSESNYIFCRDSGILKNATAQAGTNPDVDLTAEEVIGQPLRYVSDGLYRFATAAEVASAAPSISQRWGFVISGEPTGALDNDDVTGTEYAILVRGPAIINEDKIPANDVYGAAITASAYIALCKALQINTLPTPVTTVTQVNQ